MTDPSAAPEQGIAIRREQAVATRSTVLIGRGLAELPQVAATQALIASGDIFEAIEKRDVLAVRRILTANPATIKAQRENDGSEWQTPLHLAAELAAPDIVKTLLAFGADANETTSPSGSTPLHKVCKAAGGSGQTPVLPFLRHYRETSPWAERERDAIAVAKTLIDAGANVNATDRHGRPPLYICQNESIQCFLIRSGAEVAHWPLTPPGCNPLCGTPLRYFVEQSHYESIKEAIAAGADPQETDSDGRSLLYYCHKSRIAHLLVTEYNLDPYAADRFGRTPLHHAAFVGYGGLELYPHGTGVVEYLSHSYLLAADNVYELSIVDKDGRSPLHLCHKSDIASFLVEWLHLNPRAVDRFGRTPLHMAAHHGNYKFAEYLSRFYLPAAGDASECSILDEDGQTPLHICCTARIASLLIEQCGLDPCAVDYSDRTPLHIAACRGMHEVVEYLFHFYTTAAGGTSGINAQDDCGQTALHSAVEGQKLWRHIYSEYSDYDSSLFYRACYANRWLANRNATLQFLIRKGADRRRQQTHLTEYGDPGDTPLHIAARCGEASLVREILGFADGDAIHPVNYPEGPFLDIPNDQGMTPLHIATNTGSLETVSILLAAGADPSVRTSSGKTPMQLAREQGFSEILAALKDAGARD